jgi:hypothetical protein
MLASIELDRQIAPEKRHSFLEVRAYEILPSDKEALALLFLYPEVQMGVMYLVKSTLMDLPTIEWTTDQGRMSCILLIPPVHFLHHDQPIRGEEPQVVMLERSPLKALLQLPCQVKAQLDCQVLVDTVTTTEPQASVQLAQANPGAPFPTPASHPMVKPSEVEVFFLGQEAVAIVLPRAGCAVRLVRLEFKANATISTVQCLSPLQSLGHLEIAVGRLPLLLARMKQTWVNPRRMAEHCNLSGNIPPDPLHLLLLA